MRIATEYSDVKLHGEENEDSQWEVADVYELLLCVACKRVELRCYHYHDGMEEEDVNYKTLYPVSSKIPLGLPAKIQKEYGAALKVQNISANAYGVLMGRVLELVCEDRKANGDNLYKKLADLAAKKEIPEKLLPVADPQRWCSRRAGRID